MKQKRLLALPHTLWHLRSGILGALLLSLAAVCCCAVVQDTAKPPVQPIHSIPESVLGGQELTRQVTSCPSAELLSLLLSRVPPSQLNQFHIAAAATRLAHLLGESPAQGSESVNGCKPTPSQSSQAVLQHLLPWLYAHRQSVDARGTANVLWALARIKSTGAWQGVQPLPQPRANGHTVHSNGNGRHSHSAEDPALQSDAELSSAQGIAMELVLQSPPTPQTVASQLHSVAGGLWQHACSMGWRSFYAQHISNLLWAAATLGLEVSAHEAEAALTALCGKLQSLTPQGLANTLWAAAQLRLAVPQPLLDAAPQLLSLPHATPQAMSSTLLAVASLGLQPPAGWLAAVMTAVERRLPEFGPQALANTASAAVRLGYQPSKAWFHWLLSACSRNMAAMQPVELAATLQAVERLSQRHGDAAEASQRLRPTAAWLQRAADCVQPRIAHMSFSELAAVCHALAGLGWCPDARWLAAVVARLHWQLDAGAAAQSGWEPQARARACSQVAAALATWVDSPGLVAEAVGLLDRVCGLLAQHCRQPQGLHAAQSDAALPLLTALSALCAKRGDVWAQAGTGTGLQQLLAAAAGAAVQPVWSARPQQLVVLCWALAKLGQRVADADLSARLQAAASQGCLSSKEQSMLVFVCQQWYGVTSAAAVTAQLQAQPAASCGPADAASSQTHQPAALAAVTALMGVTAQWRRQADPESRALLQPYVLQLCGRVGEVSSSLSIQDVSRCLWAAAQLGYQPDAAWCDGMVRRLVQLADTQPQLAAPQLPRALWALSQLGIQPPQDAARSLLGVCMAAGAAELWQPARLCAVLTAAAAWGVQPRFGWWQRLLAAPNWVSHISAAASHASQPLSHPHHTTTTTTITTNHPSAWSDSQLIVLLQALARLGVQPPAQLLTAVFTRLASTSQPVQDVSSQGRSAGSVRVKLLLAALQLLAAEDAYLGQPGAYSTAAGEVAAVGLSTAAQLLPHLPLRARVAVLAACSHLANAAPLHSQLDLLTTTAMWASQPQLQQATPAALLRLLRVLAWLKVRPDPHWSEQLLQALRPHLRGLPAEQLARCLPLLAATRCRPSRPWLLDYLAAVKTHVLRARAQDAMHPPSSQPALAAAGLVPSPVHDSIAVASQADSHISPRAMSLMTAALYRLDPGLAKQWREHLVIQYR